MAEFAVTEAKSREAVRPEIIPVSLARLDGSTSDGIMPAVPIIYIYVANTKQKLACY